MISEQAKQIINKVENCKHPHQTKDEMFNTAKVCQDCGLVIFADQQVGYGTSRNAGHGTHSQSGKGDSKNV